jgi:hypothetical protein
VTKKEKIRPLGSFSEGVNQPIHIWVSFKQILEHYGIWVYDWLCVDLIDGFFPPNDIKFVHEKVSLTVEQLRELYRRECHNALFIGHYVAPWHVHWLAFEQWRMRRGLPHSVEFQIAIDPITAPINATPSAEPASTASEKPTRVRVSSKKLRELIEEYIDPVTGKVPGRDALYSMLRERGYDISRERIDAILRTKYEGRIRPPGRPKSAI